MKRIVVLCCAVAVLAFGFVDAQSVVVPNANTNVAGSSGANTLLLIYPLFIGHIPIALGAGGRFDLNLPFPTAAFGVELQAYATDTTTRAGFVVTNAVSFTIGP